MKFILFEYAKGNTRVAINADEIVSVEEVRGIGELNTDTGKWDRVEHARVHTKSGAAIDVVSSFDDTLKTLGKIKD